MHGYLQKWVTLEKYRLQESSLNLLFRRFCPQNTEIEHVLLKVSVLNDFYSTNIFDTHAVARHIQRLKPDNRLKDGDAVLVNDLAKVTIAGKIRIFYSFASKFCNHHNADSFPIYDSYVEKMLMHFNRKNPFASFQKPDLRHYPTFVEIIRAFQSQYDLGRFTLREMDIYLWLAGKDAFKQQGSDGG